MNERASRAATILRNVAINWAGFAINAAVTLVLTPFVLHQLGAAKYGVWVLTSSVIGYYGLLDLGFRGGVTQFLTRYLAVHDYVKASECMSSAVSALSVIGAATVLLSGIMAYIAPHLFVIPPEIQADAFWCILIVGCTSALQFVLFPFAAVFTAKQRFDLANFVGILSRLATAALVFLALRRGYGLIGVSAATCGVNAVDYLVRWRIARHIEPNLKVSLGLARKERLREIASFGTWNFQISVSQYAEMHAQTLIISFLLPIAAAGHYSLATGLVFQIGALLGPIGQVIYPAAAAMHAKEEHGGLERLFRDGTRLVLLATVSILFIASFWAQDFYRLWIGEKYVSGVPFPSVATLLQILLVGTLAGYTSNIAGQILLGMGRVRQLALALLGRTVLDVALMLVLIRPFGLIGVATASAVSATVTNVAVIPLIFRKITRFQAGRLLLEACLRPLAVAGALAILLSLIRLTGRPEDWAHLFAQGALAGATAAGAVLILGITGEERERFVTRPLRRLLKLDVAGAQIR